MGFWTGRFLLSQSDRSGWCCSHLQVTSNMELQTCRCTENNITTTQLSTATKAVPDWHPQKHQQHLHKHGQYRPQLCRSGWGFANVSPPPTLPPPPPPRLTQWLALVTVHLRLIPRSQPLEFLVPQWKASVACSPLSSCCHPGLLPKLPPSLVVEVCWWLHAYTTLKHRGEHTHTANSQE